MTLIGPTDGNGNDSGSTSSSSGDGSSGSGENGATGTGGDPSPPEEEEEPPVIQIIAVKTGDTINLEEEIDKDDFDSFTTFKSTQFFVSEFERSDQLLKNEKEVNDDDSGFPIWIIIMIASIVVVFAIIICSICYMMKKNRQSRDL